MLCSRLFIYYFIIFHFTKNIKNCKRYEFTSIPVDVTILTSIQWGRSNRRRTKRSQTNWDDFIYCFCRRCNITSSSHRHGPIISQIGNCILCEQWRVLNSELKWNENIFLYSFGNSSFSFLSICRRRKKNGIFVSFFFCFDVRSLNGIQFDRRT